MTVLSTDAVVIGGILTLNGETQIPCNTNIYILKTLTSMWKVIKLCEFLCEEDLHYTESSLKLAFMLLDFWRAFCIDSNYRYIS